MRRYLSRTLTLALLTAAELLLTASLAAAAQSRFYVQSGTSGLTAKGPTIVFYGINPFRESVTGPFETKDSLNPAPTIDKSITGTNDLDEQVRNSSPKSATSPKCSPSAINDQTYADCLQNPAKPLDVSNADKRIKTHISRAQADVLALSKLVDEDMAVPITSASLASEVTALITPYMPDFTYLKTDAYLLKMAESKLNAFSDADASKAAAEKDAATTQAALTAFDADYPIVVRGNAEISDFERSGSVDCGNFQFGGTATEEIKVTDLSDNKGTSYTEDVAVTCPSRLALSGGAIFTIVPNTQFTAEPKNVPSSSTTTTASIIEPSNISNVSTSIFAFTHYNLTPQCSEPCVYFSFGAGTASKTTASGSSPNLDFASGLSVGVLSFVFVTAGIHLTQGEELAPGYAVGQTIARTTSPPTINVERPAFFLGVTFGKSSNSSSSTPQNGAGTTNAAPTTTSSQHTADSALIAALHSRKPSVARYDPRIRPRLNKIAAR